MITYIFIVLENRPKRNRSINRISSSSFLCLVVHIFSPDTHHFTLDLHTKIFICGNWPKNGKHLHQNHTKNKRIWDFHPKKHNLKHKYQCFTPNLNTKHIYMWKPTQKWKRITPDLHTHKMNKGFSHENNTNFQPKTYQYQEHSSFEAVRSSFYPRDRLSCADNASDIHSDGPIWYRRGTRLSLECNSMPRAQTWICRIFVFWKLGQVLMGLMSTYGGIGDKTLLRNATAVVTD